MRALLLVFLYIALYSTRIIIIIFIIFNILIKNNRFFLRFISYLFLKYYVYDGIYHVGDSLYALSTEFKLYAQVVTG